eukprot:CAMPEP_0172159174 /NCGR_PEP_ID=MMETSP1050-20130122/4813_1 /TAXON_ID=233186 /ORGANISM="Cryptomonas curvata, Strain CCAP979/52" /LENGTH=513 /DNA_ID=CAMNT_0012828711 /DNA_START=52 /DNA_END=1590 /DNA_ORIENTATION=+
MPPATYDEPKTSVEVVGAHALKMGWMEKAEEESFMKGWHKRFVVLTGWEAGEAHIFYYADEQSTEASGIIFVHDVTVEQDKTNAKCIVLQGSQRRFRFRCDTDLEARIWRQAIGEAKDNGGHQCQTGSACMAWMADKHAKTCESCRTVFSAAQRKHHCRCCGRVFCADCSSQPKLLLHPYPQPVRCCSKCHETQTQQMAAAKARAQRAQTFVQRHLTLLDRGAQFGYLDGASIRTDMACVVALDDRPNVSLQFRRLVVTDILLESSVSIGDKIASKAKNLQSATIRGLGRIASLRPSHVVNAIETADLGKTAVAIKDGVGTAASAVASEIAEVAQHIKDTVEGVSSYEIPIKDFIGIQDYAGNQSKRTKHGPDLAARLLAIQYRTSDHPLELVAATQEEKNRWIEALLELKYLADDAGTDVLVFQREKEEKAQRIKETIDQRKEERLNKVLHEAAAKKDSEDGGSRARAVASASLKMGGAAASSRIPSASLGGTSPGNASPKPIASASLGGRA